MDSCDYLVPGHDPFLGGKPCIRHHAHSGPHLVVRDNQGYVAWEKDYECTECEPLDECECFVHWEVSNAEVAQMINE